MVKLVAPQKRQEFNGGAYRVTAKMLRVF